MTADEEKAGTWKSWFVFVPLFLCLGLIFLIRSMGENEKDVSHSTNPERDFDLSGEISDQDIVELVSNKGKLSDRKRSKDGGNEGKESGSPLGVKRQEKSDVAESQSNRVDTQSNSTEGELASASSINNSAGGISSESPPDDTPASQLELSSPVGLLNQPTEEMAYEFNEPVEIQLQDGELLVTEKGSAVERLFEALKLDSLSESFTLGRVGFQTDSANLSDGSRIQIRNIARVLNDYPAFKVEIRLPRGGDAKISQQRVEQIRGTLMSEGVDSSRLQAAVTESSGDTGGQPSISLTR